jgi:hypothetical protein
MAARTVIPWMPVYGDMPTHEKSVALEIATGIERAWTHMLELCLWCLTNRPDGFVGDLSPALLAKSASVPKAKAQVFADAIRAEESLFVDPDGRIHDWDRYAGAYLRKREGNRTRQTRRRHGAQGPASGPTVAPVTRDIGVTDGVTSRHGHAPREEEKREDQITHTSESRSHGSADATPAPSESVQGQQSQTDKPTLKVHHGQGIRAEPPPTAKGPRPKSPWAVMGEQETRDFLHAEWKKRFDLERLNAACGAKAADAFSRAVVHVWREFPDADPRKLLLEVMDGHARDSSVMDPSPGTAKFRTPWVLLSPDGIERGLRSARAVVGAKNPAEQSAAPVIQRPLTDERGRDPQVLKREKEFLEQRPDPAARSVRPVFGADPVEDPSSPSAPKLRPQLQQGLRQAGGAS